MADLKRDTAIELQEANEHISAAERSIANLEGDLGNRERELSSARQALSHAEGRLQAGQGIHIAIAAVVLFLLFLKSSVLIHLSRRQSSLSYSHLSSQQPP